MDQVQRNSNIKCSAPLLETFRNTSYFLTWQILALLLETDMVQCVGSLLLYDSGKPGLVKYVPLNFVDESHDL
jgi:hypothetical protein